MTGCFVRFGPDHQPPRAVVDAAHRIGGIAQQVHDHLLKLDTVAADRWKLVGQFGAQNHPASLKVTGRQGDHFSHSIVEIDRFDRGGLSW